MTITETTVGTTTTGERAGLLDTLSIRESLDGSRSMG
jgi:hypothetical protein